MKNLILTSLLAASALITGCMGQQLPEESNIIIDNEVELVVEGNDTYCESTPELGFHDAYMCNAYSYCFDEEVDPNNPPAHCMRVLETFDPMVCLGYEEQELKATIEFYKQCNHKI